MGALGLRYLPSIPSVFRRAYAPRPGAWKPVNLAIPSNLQSVAGINRDIDAEEAAFKAAPLRNLVMSFPKIVETVGIMNWPVFLILGPMWGRAKLKAYKTRYLVPLAKPRTLNRDELSKLVKQRAMELGISAIGVAKYDPKYTFAHEQQARSEAGDRVIVCLLESNYKATQSAPSVLAERAAVMGTLAITDMAADLARYLVGLGFHASAASGEGFGVHINYAVQAGLGQLGLNGQLLTPIAGSRCRMIVIQTDAPLNLDSPVDYGIPKICDECKVCVRRCPPPQYQPAAWYRGVEKAKVKLTKCWPTTVQAHGCAICTKVCPVQKYGLSAVVEEFQRSGYILGKGTEELPESCDWIDGKGYGVGLPPSFQKVGSRAEFSDLTDDAAYAPSRY